MKLEKKLYNFSLIGIAFSIIMILGIIVFPPRSINEIKIESPQNFTKKLTKDTQIEQNFQAQIDEIDELVLYVESIQKKSGVLELKIYEGAKLISITKVEIKSLNSNQPNTIKIKRIKNANSKKIKVSLHLTEENEITLKTNGNYSENQYVLYNNQKLKQSLTFNYIGNKYNIGYIWYFLVLINILLIIVVFLKDSKEGKK